MDLESEIEKISVEKGEKKKVEDMKRKDVWYCRDCEKTFKLERGKKPLKCHALCGKDSNKTAFEAETGPFKYFDDQQKKFVPFKLGREIKYENNFFVHPESDEIYYYEDGIYNRLGDRIVRSIAQKKLHNKVRNQFVEETVEYVRRCGDLRPERYEINEEKRKIVVKNGVLDIITNKLNRHDPKQIHTVKIPWKYDPDADLGMIEDFLYDIVKDEDVKLLQEMFGYCLYKDYPIAKAFMLHGSGANGKSTLLNLLERLLGRDNVASPSLHHLLQRRFTKVELHNKLANIHSDISGDQLYNTGTFKMLTGEDTIEGQRKYKDPIEFKNFAKLIYACNNLPSTNDTTKAFFRRWILIDFPYVFDEDDEGTDPDILDKLVTEEQMSALLNWSIEGLNRILECGGFSTTEKRSEIETKWMRQADSLKSFFSECVEVDIDSWISKNDLRNAYKAYCNQLDLEVESKTRMTKNGPQMEPRTESPNDYRPEAHDGSRVQAWKNLKLSEWFYDNVEGFAPEYTSEIKAQVDERQNQLEIDEKCM